MEENNWPSSATLQFRTALIKVDCSWTLISYVSDAFSFLHFKQEHPIGMLCCLQQATGGGDGGYDDFQEGTSGGDGGYGGYGGFSGYGGSYGGHTHDDDDEDDDDDDEEGSDDEGADGEEDEDEEEEYGAGQSLGMAALNIKEFKIEGSSSSTKGKSTK